jgi:hypothetical protein
MNPTLTRQLADDHLREMRRAAADHRFAGLQQRRSRGSRAR